MSVSTTATPQGGAIIIEGLEEFLQAMQAAKTSGQRAAVASGIGAGMNYLARQLRKGVSATNVRTPHAASLKAGMRKSIRAKFLKGGLDRLGKQHATVAKVGFAVGQPPGDERLSRGTTASRERVGVTQETTHWFVLGTPKRVDSQMPAFMEGLVARTAASSGEAAMRVAAEKATERLMKDLAKRLKKAR